MGFDDNDDDDLVVYGTPIEREEDTSARKRRAVAEAGQLRALPAWKQEVRDEEGRRRFHGAFTGGFSAGYYNTVGTKEGWTPQTFTSSRKNRAEVKKQSVYSFLDEEDIKDMGGNALETSQQYDTFGLTATEYARKQASKEQKERPSAIPGPIPDELVVPATTSIGVKLLMKMGWRQGRSIRDAHTDSLYESRREARKAFLALSGINTDGEKLQIDSHKSDKDEKATESLEGLHSTGNTPVYVLHPKQDLHGLGFDPFKHAPEFKDRKRLQKSARDCNRSGVSMRGSLLISNSGQYAPGFGIGALEDLGVEDEDIYASGFAYEQMEVDIEPPKTANDSNYKLEDRKRGVFLAFKIASSSEYKLERFDPPDIPANFDGRHKFLTPLQAVNNFSDLAPPEVPPPEDTSLRLLIEGCAAMVARCGKHIEDFYKEKSKTNTQFNFLNEGDGCSYYSRKLWEYQQKYIDQRRPDTVKSKTSSDKLTAENRGKILGEKPLDRSTKPSSSSLPAKETIQLQSNLGDTFVKPISLDGLPEYEKPFRNDPAKQARFEQFLKDKYQGGLRAANLIPTSTMSDADRARERLDFEAAAETIEKGKEKKALDPLSLLGLTGINEQRFVSSTESEKLIPAQDEKSIYPRREEFEWRPSPILCKRFDIVDPFMGKPMYVQRPRSKMDSLIFMSESSTRTNDKEESSSIASQHTSEPGTTEIEAKGSATDPDIGSSSMQKPVDLYKAIFSDDSDDDMDEPLTNQPVDPVKTSEDANMVLNRLVAEDFLESLGKELGLDVPPEKPTPPNVLFRPEMPSTANASSISRNGKATTSQEIKENKSSLHKAVVANASADAPSDNAERLDLKYEKQEHRAEKGSLHYSHRQTQSVGLDSDSTSDQHRSRKRRSRHQIRSGSPDSDSSVERRRSKKRKSHSSHRTRRSKSPYADSSSDSQHTKRKRREKKRHQTRIPDTDSSDHEYEERHKSSSRRSSDKDRSRRRSRHHKR
ncbi:G patch domain-containing protein TGH homolog [Oryza brachyantha]|uniref:G patch domain-containing protein TGH homolog n=1 Tax=Oryza brachyantha TaxID=4533 RepID=J3MEA3_ORYBR|nr:G patch domain-containing protein TGH homolog [Oryza brachyantha]